MILVFGHINTHIHAGLQTPLTPDSLNITACDSLFDISGSSTIQAVSAARGGAKVSLIGTVGNDIFGTHCIETLRKEGINTSGIGKSETDSGLEISLNHPDNAAMTVTSLGANKHTHAGQIPQIHLNERSLLLLSGDIDHDILLTLLERAKAQNARTMLCLQDQTDIDINTLSRADIVVTTENSALLHQKTKSENTIVITRNLGVGGAAVHGENGQDVHYEQANDAHSLVDTHGCFDVFCGFFAACVQAGLPIERSIAFASKAALAAAQKSGIYTSVPYLGYVEDMLAQDAKTATAQNC